MFYVLFVFSLSPSFFSFLIEREEYSRGRVIGGTALYHLNTVSRTRCSILEGVGKIVEGKIAPRATFHFPAKCALLRPPTNNDFHRFDGTFFLPFQTWFFFLPSSLFFSLLHTPHPVNPRILEYSDRLLFRFLYRNMFLLNI